MSPPRLIHTYHKINISNWLSSHAATSQLVLAAGRWQLLYGQKPSLKPLCKNSSSLSSCPWLIIIKKLRCNCFMGRTVWYYLWKEWMSHKVSVLQERRLIPLLIAWRCPDFPSSHDWFVRLCVFWSISNSPLSFLTSSLGQTTYSQQIESIFIQIFDMCFKADRFPFWECVFIVLQGFHLRPYVIVGGP